MPLPTPSSFYESGVETSIYEGRKANASFYEGNCSTSQFMRARLANRGLQHLRVDVPCLPGRAFFALSCDLPAEKRWFSVAWWKRVSHEMSSCCEFVGGGAKRVCLFELPALEKCVPRARHACAAGNHDLG